MKVQEVRWDKDGTESAEDCTFFYVKATIIITSQQDFLCTKKLSAIKAEEFVSDRMSRIAVRGHRCHIIVLNRHARNNKSDDSNDSLYEKFGQVFDNFPKYTINSCQEVLIQNWGEKIFLNRQFGMGDYMKVLKF